jgi:hypothetical protein
MGQGDERRSLRFGLIFGLISPRSPAKRMPPGARAGRANPPDPEPSRDQIPRVSTPWDEDPNGRSESSGRFYVHWATCGGSWAAGDTITDRHACVSAAPCPIARHAGGCRSRTRRCETKPTKQSGSFFGALECCAAPAMTASERSPPHGAAGVLLARGSASAADGA